MRASLCFAAALLCLGLAAPGSNGFRFVILGDRTGECLPGVYEQALREAAADNPAFLLSVGDSIQGLHDRTADAEWRKLRRIQARLRMPLYSAPGNHDVWSPLSERLYERYTGRPAHYSFDYEQAHFTILNNSRSDALSADELAFLESDLKAHAEQPLKFVVSHRPSWIFNVMLRNPHFPLHDLSKKYGVQYVIAGHVHEMLHAELDRVTYLSMASSGGHLRGSAQYEDGWFFGHTLVEVRGTNVQFHIKELKAPHGQGRVTGLADWTMFGVSGK